MQIPLQRIVLLLLLGKLASKAISYKMPPKLKYGLAVHDKKQACKTIFIRERQTKHSDKLLAFWCCTEWSVFEILNINIAFFCLMLFIRPMMVITQKITSLAFEIHDGKTSIKVSLKCVCVCV